MSTPCPKENIFSLRIPINISRSSTGISIFIYSTSESEGKPFILYFFIISLVSLKYLGSPVNHFNLNILIVRNISRMHQQNHTRYITQLLFDTDDDPLPDEVALGDSTADNDMDDEDQLAYLRAQAAQDAAIAGAGGKPPVNPSESGGNGSGQRWGRPRNRNRNRGRGGNANGNGANPGGGRFRPQDERTGNVDAPVTSETSFDSSGGQGEGSGS
jgi:hypothetical protein